MSELRPTRLTPEMALEVARHIVHQLVEYGLVEDEAQAAADLAKYGDLYRDGYEIAKELDDHCYWDCNFQVAKILDSFSYEASQLVRKAQKEWAERTGILPTLTTGQRVKTPRGAVGVIDGVYEHGPAQYLVKLDGDSKAEPPTNARSVINFEDAAPIT